MRSLMLNKTLSFDLQTIVVGVKSIVWCKFARAETV